VQVTVRQIWYITIGMISALNAINVDYGLENC
jgi:hypothetical protein